MPQDINNTGGNPPAGGQNPGNNSGQNPSNNSGQTPPAGGQDQGNSGQNPPGAGGGKPPATYDEFFAGLDNHHKGLIEDNIKGLKTALQDERQQRQNLADQVKEMAKGATGATKEQLEKMQNDLELANRKAAFYEQAATAEIADVRLAWLAIEADKLYDRKGLPDMAALKANYPHLFKAPRQQLPAGNAGAGTGGNNPPALNMNQRIRQAAGRQ